MLGLDCDGCVHDYKKLVNRKSNAASESLFVQEIYVAGGAVNFTMSEVLRPIQQTAIFAE
jgi:hypothetical protein